MAIIGISGKAQSGKDTVGKIIQYLTSLNHHIPFNEYVGSEYDNENFCDWKIKRFADKLKQICSILTGIPIEYFEKQEVKDIVIGEEWDRWYNYHYKLKTDSNPTGRISPYKSTQEEVEKDNLLIQETISGHSFTKESITVRQLLQQVGTDAMRNVIHPNVWVNALFADYKLQVNKVHFKRMDVHRVASIARLQYSQIYNGKYPNWIITDCRFSNEAEAIISRGGLLIRVNSEWKHTFTGKLKTFNTFTNDNHESETALDNYQFAHVIDNNRTIEELIEQVKQILIKEKIL